MATPSANACCGNKGYCKYKYACPIHMMWKCPYYNLSGKRAPKGTPPHEYSKPPPAATQRVAQPNLQTLGGKGFCRYKYACPIHLAWQCPYYSLPGKRAPKGTPPHEYTKPVKPGTVTNSVAGNSGATTSKLATPQPVTQNFSTTSPSNTTKAVTITTTPLNKVVTPAILQQGTSGTTSTPALPINSGVSSAGGNKGYCKYKYACPIHMAWKCPYYNLSGKRAPKGTPPHEYSKPPQAASKKDAQATQTNLSIPGSMCNYQKPPIQQTVKCNVPTGTTGSATTSNPTANIQAAGQNRDAMQIVEQVLDTLRDCGINVGNMRIS